MTRGYRRNLNIYEDYSGLTKDQKKIIARKIAGLKNQEKFINLMNNLK